MRGWTVADGGELDTGAEMVGGINSARELGHQLCHSCYLALLAETLIRAATRGLLRRGGVETDNSSRLKVILTQSRGIPMVFILLFLTAA